MKKLTTLLLLTFSFYFLSAQEDLTGTIIGTPGSWGDDPTCTIDAVFDDNTATYFDAPGIMGGNDCWAGLSLDTNYIITKISYYPRAGNAARMDGGIFQGSITADFSSGVVDLFTISGVPVDSWTVQTISSTDSFKYVRYLSPDGGNGNVAEVIFTGYAASDKSIVIVEKQHLPRLGMNIGGISDWSVEFVWNDLARYMRYERFGDGFTSDQFDENGFPLRLTGNQSISYGYGNGTNYAWPAGEYHIFYDGEGTIEGRTVNETFVSEVAPGHEIWNVTHTNDFFMGFEITATTEGNHLHNLRMIMPGFEDTYEENPIHPSFVKHWQEFEAFRFMDWSGTNNSPIVEWDDVTLPTAISQQMPMELGAGHAASPHLAVELCNIMKKDAWFCMPHQASDDCIRKWAEMVRDSIDPTLKIYVEYSNEVWNWMFQQAAYSRDMAQALIDPGIGGALEYYVYRCGEMWAIWEDVFGADDDRVINVFAWQNNSTGWINTAVTDWMNDPVYNPAGTHPEFIACAPYIHDENIEVTDLTTFFNASYNEDLPYIESTFKSMQNLVDGLGLEYGCYEAGQHYAEGNGTTNTDLDNLYWDANRDMRMEGVYDRYLSSWRDTCGGLMMMFSSISQYGEYGSWGALERYNQDTTTAPKYLAMKNFLANKQMVETINVTAAGGATAISTEGGTLQLSAEVLPAEAGQGVLWTVDNSTLATIDQAGLLTAVGNGTVTAYATATDGSHVVGSIQIVLSNQAQLVESITVTATGGATTLTDYMGTLQCSANVLPANAVNQDVTWSVSPALLASIDQTGLLTSTGNGNGVVTVRATADDGSQVEGTLDITFSNQLMLVSSITVTSAGGVTSIVEDEFLQLTANILPANADDPSVTWSSGNTGIAAVSPTSGFVQAISEGTVTITATANDGSGITGTIVLDVISPQIVLISDITVTSAGNVTSILVGDDLQLSASVLPANADDLTYTWSSSNDALATISATGLVRGVSSGSVTLTATANDGSGVTGTIVLNISTTIGINANKSEGIVVYPNPLSDNYLNVILNNVQSDEIISIKLTDISGKIIKDEQFKNTNKYTLSINGLEKGLYIIEISSNEIFYKSVLVK